MQITLAEGIVFDSGLDFSLTEDEYWTKNNCLARGIKYLPMF